MARFYNLALALCLAVLVLVASAQAQNDTGSAGGSGPVITQVNTDPAGGPGARGIGMCSFRGSGFSQPNCNTNCYYAGSTFSLYVIAGGGCYCVA